MTIKAQVSLRMQVLELVREAVPSGVGVAAREDAFTPRVDVWLSSPWWWRVLRRGRRRVATVAACSAVADAPAGVMVRVHWTR